MTHKAANRHHYPKIFQCAKLPGVIHHGNRSWLLNDCECFCATCIKDLWIKWNKKNPPTTLRSHWTHPDCWSTKKPKQNKWVLVGICVFRLVGGKKTLNTTGISKGASKGIWCWVLERKTSRTGMIILHPTFIQGCFWEIGTLKRPQHCFSVPACRWNTKYWNNNEFNCAN